MDGKFWRWTHKAFILLLCLLLLMQASIVYAEEESAPPTVTTVETATAAPTDVPATEKPVSTDTSTPSATDTTTPADTTVTPTDTTTTPDSSATPEGSATPAPEETAPTCDIPDCPHVTVDADGNTIALCPLGEWMLAHGLGTPEPLMAGMMALLSATDSTTIALTDGTTTIYRSGTYVLTGGTATTEVVINPNLAVAILLQGVTINKLTIGNGASAQFDFSDSNLVNLLHTGDGEILFDGTGSLVVNTVDDLGNATMTMAGGSLLLPDAAISANGRKRYDFNATGASSAIVDNAYFPFSQPDGSDVAHLWLPLPDAGESYRSTVVSGVLTVLSAPEEPSGSTVFDMDGTPELKVVAGQSYAIVSGTGTPIAHTLTVDQSGVTLVLNNVDFSTTADVTLLNTSRLHLNGSVNLKSVSTTATANLSGTATLLVGTLNVAALNCANTVKLCFGTNGGACFSAWQTLVSPTDLDAVTSLTYNGQSYAIAYAASDHLTVYTPLPTPASGMRYDLQLNGTTLTATQIPVGTQTLVMGATGIHITASGSYVIVSDGDTTGGLIIADGLNVSLILRDARTSGSLTVGAGATVTANLEGSNRFDGDVTLGDGVTFTVGGSGALLTSTISALGTASTTIGANTNVSLTSGTTIGGSSLKPTVISVTDGSTLPVTDTAITLKIGTNKPIHTTTAANGHVTLWGTKAVTNASVVVLSQLNTYADILTGDLANPDALPVITNVVIHDNSYVSFSVTNAQTAGIQYYLNRPGDTMPDTYDASAQTVARLFGQCNIPGLKKGDVVTFRAYAARATGQILSAETADAFQFSDQYTYTVGAVRKTYTLADQSKEYDLYAFKFASGLIPKGATVTYYKGKTELSSAPTDVGTYTATVVIPEGNSEYLPGAVSVTITITPKVVWIYPEPSSKLKGQKDPEFFYTYSDMFGDDEVTGVLTRYVGEKYGNYPYITSVLSAPSYYELKIDPDSPMFFIDWGPGHYIKVDPLSIIDPVHQVIEFSNGMKLDLILSTADKLNISHVGYSKLVTDSETHETRPFTPELRLKRGYDQAMIILRAEPEINTDGGYVTDADGNIELRGRTLTLSAYHLNNFKRQHITTVGFRLDDAMMILDFSDLTSDKVRKAMTDAGIPAIGTVYQITFTPVNSVSDLKDYPEKVQTEKALGARMMGMRVELKNGSQMLDISALLPSAQAVFDISTLLAEESETSQEISEVTIGKKAGQTVDENSVTTDTMELVQKLMLDKLKKLGTLFQYYAAKIEKLDSQLVVPYTASETEALTYTAVMKTSPFLIAKFHKNGLYGLSQTILP